MKAIRRVKLNELPKPEWDYDIQQYVKPTGYFVLLDNFEWVTEYHYHEYEDAWGCVYVEEGEEDDII